MSLLSNYPALLLFYQLCLFECLGQSGVTFTASERCGIYMKHLLVLVKMVQLSLLTDEMMSRKKEKRRGEIRPPNSFFCLALISFLGGLIIHLWAALLPFWALLTPF